jgi:uncharacterized RDD family membrane protein YckC
METAVQHVCTSCGNPLLPDGRFCLFCGDVLADVPQQPGIASQNMPPGLTDAKLAGPPEYAGFWLRVWAGLIDVFLEALAAMLITLLVWYVYTYFGPRSGISPITISYLAGIGFIAVLAVGSWLYSAFAESSNWRATIGKRVMGLQVETARGERLNFGQASVRHFMKFLSLFTAAVGFMMAAWTKRCQALHDMPVDSVVVKVAEPSLSLFGKQS